MQAAERACQRADLAPQAGTEIVPDRGARAGIVDRGHGDGRLRASEQIAEVEEFEEYPGWLPHEAEVRQRQG